jgi:hypothetical protein
MNRREYFKKLSQIYSVLLCFFLTFLLGCDYRPKLSIEGGSVPLFKVEGRGSIQVINIYGPNVENPNTQAAGSRSTKTYWQIAPMEDYDVERLAKSEGLVYGQVPKGFKQVVPENGAAPPPLLENQHYTFSLRLVKGSGVGAGFTIHNGRVGVEGIAAPQ